MGYLVAYGPVSDIRPFIPERLVLSQDKVVVSVGRGSDEEVEIGDNGLQKLIQYGGVTRLGFSEPFQVGCWPCIDAGGITWIPKEKEGLWRATKAQEIMGNLTGLKDPVQVLSGLQVCAHLTELDMSALLVRLESNRTDPSESLVDIFQRIKK